MVCSLFLQMKFLAMHITNQKLRFFIGNLPNIFMEHDLYLILMTFNVLLAITTNITMLIRTGPK